MTDSDRHGYAAGSGCGADVSCVTKIPKRGAKSGVLRRQGFKFETRLNGEQVRKVRRFAGACRFVYNNALALTKDRCTRKEKRLGYVGLAALLPAWKQEFGWLSDV